MDDLRLYRVGEEVFIKTKVTGVTIVNGLPEYNLMNPQEGRPFPWRFMADQVYPTGEKKNEVS